MLKPQDNHIYLKPGSDPDLQIFMRVLSFLQFCIDLNWVSGYGLIKESFMSIFSFILVPTVHTKIFIFQSTYQGFYISAELDLKTQFGYQSQYHPFLQKM